MKPRVSILLSDDTESRQAEFSVLESSLEKFPQLVSLNNSLEVTVAQTAWAQNPS